MSGFTKKRGAVQPQVLLEGQNEQTEELIQGLEQQEQMINTMTASLRNANFIILSLSAILGIFLVFIIIHFIRKK